MNRYLAVTLAACLPLAAHAFGNDGFDAGFQHGYATGYKQSSGSSIDPIPPIPPIERIPRLNDPESSYERGYLEGLQRGFEKGDRRRYGR